MVRILDLIIWDLGLILIWDLGLILIIWDLVTIWVLIWDLVIIWVLIWDLVTVLITAQGPLISTILAPTVTEWEVLGD